MARRKQRRRREKLQRHEYEYVVETEEGEEVVESLRDIEAPSDPAPRRGERRSGRNGSRSRALSRGTSRGPVDRRGRPIPKPSLQRVLKRALIFMPFFVLFFFIAAPGLTLTQKIFQAVLLAALFIPASYLADRLIYRMAERRQLSSTGRARR